MKHLRRGFKTPTSYIGSLCLILLHGTAVSDHCTDDEDDDDVIVDIITNGPNVPAQPRIVSLASVH